MEVTVEMPPASAVDYRVDVNIHIYPEHRVYGANLFALGQSKKIQIAMTERDLLSLNQEMQRAMEEIASKAAGSEIKDGEHLLEVLRPLADLGYVAFRRVFGNNHETISELLKYLRSESKGRAVCVEISSDDFFLPWELLYPVAPGGGPIAVNNFWGMRYVIARILTRGLPGNFVQPRINASAKPSVALLAQKELQSVASREIPYFELLEKCGKIQLSQLVDLDPIDRCNSMQKFREFFRSKFNFVHFAGHASYEEPPDLSYFVVTNMFSISIRDLDLFDIGSLDQPLVVLNACETGNLNPLYTSCFARAMCERGARGVLATECVIPDEFASEFSERIYDGLWRGLSIGERMLDARQTLLEQEFDPCGLFYSLYGPPTIHLSINPGVFGNTRVFGDGERLTQYERGAWSDFTSDGHVFDKFGKENESERGADE